GIIYRQFSITIISSMLLSVLVALILTPVLCASLLKPMGKGHEAAETGSRLLRPFFLWFDHMFLRLRGRYQAAVGHMLGARLGYLAVFVLVVAALGFLFVRMPTAYLPDEDQGVLMAMVQLPPGSTLEQTEAVMQKVQNHFLVDQKEAVESCLTIAGFGFAGQAQNQGFTYIKLRDWDLRNRPDLRMKGILGKAMPFLASVREATVYAFPPPAVTELGTAKGFDFMLQDRGGLGHEVLMNARLQLMGQAMRDPRLTAVRPNGMPDQAEYKVWKT
ncbi:MAG: efflux RND transporter permease subunit, partial [Syntrophales bacterium LBB04]|nr:efflux RND transporter permease subunit [Syntrophales bacterium LBB04]